MTCERYREQIPECLAGRLEKAARERLIEHLEGCSACRGELAHLGTVWRGLEALQAPEPEVAMGARFRETLAAFQEGMAQATARQLQPRSRWRFHAAWQLAAALFLLGVGLTAGRYLVAPHQAQPDVAELRGQVDRLRELVTLSMLEGPSPGSRLQGVTYASQVTRPDQQVEDALVFAATRDPNVNVRLSAIQALQKFSANPSVRQALARDIGTQDSPLVQVALIDLLAGAHAADSAAAIQRLASDPSLDPAVRERAGWALQQLKVPETEVVK